MATTRKGADKETTRELFKQAPRYNELAKNSVILAKEWFEDGKNKAPSNIVDEVKADRGERIVTMYESEDTTVHEIFTNAVNVKNKWSDTLGRERKNILLNFSNEIGKNLELFCQIEMCARGVSRKHTTKSIRLLADYLEYYASYAVRLELENELFKPKGLAMCIMAEESPLFLLGTALGPALAAGYQIILQTDLNLTQNAKLLIELAIKAGVPEKTLILIQGNGINIQSFLSHPDVTLALVFGNLYNEKFNIFNDKLIKLLTFSYSKIPMIIFGDADIESACDFLVKVAWGSGKLDIFSINTVLVQENILNEFKTKLKQRMDKIKISTCFRKYCDISELIHDDNNLTRKCEEATQEARLRGDDFYQHTDITAKYFSADVLMGGNINPNNVIKENDDVPILIVSAFRTIAEGVSLANNSRQGFGVSVWTQNISVANDVVRKLKVGNVWINCNECFYAPHITISPFKDSGNFYIGGEEGFYQFVNVKELNKSEAHVKCDSPAKGEFVEAISLANKAQVNWSKLLYMGRVKCLRKFAENIQTLANATKDSKMKEWLNDCVKVIDVYGTKLCISGSEVYKSYNVNTYIEPRGVIIIECGQEITSHNKMLIFAALISGNSVILLNSSPTASETYNEFAKTLTGSGAPAGVFAVFSGFNNDVIKTVTLHKEVNLYISECFRPEFASAPLKDSKKFNYVVDNKWKEIVNIVTLRKNVWSDINSSIV